MILLPTATRVS